MLNGQHAARCPSATATDDGTGRYWLGRVGSGQVGSSRVGSGQDGTGRVGSGRVGTALVGSGRVGTVLVGSDQMRSGRNGVVREMLGVLWSGDGMSRGLSCSGARATAFTRSAPGSSK